MRAWLQAATRRIKHAPESAWLWSALAAPVGCSLTAHARLVRSTSSVEERGPGAAFLGPAIYVNWHRHLPYLVVQHGERGRWMMVSRAPYMEPIARWCRRMGIQLARGASGDAGREALDELREALRRGESVVLAVDGPAGPPFRVKRGCVELARSAGVPIIPVAYRSRHGREVPGRWDRMLLVRPFDRVTVTYGEPLTPGAESDAAVRDRLAEALDALDPALTGRRP